MIPYGWMGSGREGGSRSRYRRPGLAQAPDRPDRPQSPQKWATVAATVQDTGTGIRGNGLMDEGMEGMEEGDKEKLVDTR